MSRPPDGSPDDGSPDVDEGSPDVDPPPPPPCGGGPDGERPDPPQLAMNVWAPAVWRALHLIALGAPREPEAAADRAEAYVRFFEAVGAVLPCPECADGYGALLAADDGKMRRELVEASRNGTLFEWSVALHNAVTRKVRRDGRDGRDDGGQDGGQDDDWTPARALAALLPAASPYLQLPPLQHPHGGTLTFAGAVAALAVGFLVAWLAWAVLRAAVSAAVSVAGRELCREL